ncbi:conserved hypothetical protein [Bradyrhizobium sp. ORS 375]|uniref:hypothetical protein n=1 Tax=Bradyrhizobium sp. (strain ORS 375) TaxID=566679 RepID=UPI0002405EBC|nr:hypothetical protein [Bradyrhizobium sp. ORS 375]CCD95022.1 conserved hypothetical protein [Bradyrhizobium sp. ORS 375]
MAGNSIGLGIIVPSPYVIELSKLRQQLEEAHLAWAIEWKRQQQEFVIENIRFAHDPRWNERVFSLQAARDGKTWVWRATRIILTCSGLSV